ncbi:MAG TPA: hypothetical protein VFQ37_12920 [Mycobacterium sp.]|nr:hypothetical protein [Mycobacterium sp.]
MTDPSSEPSPPPTRQKRRRPMPTWLAVVLVGVGLIVAVAAGALLRPALDGKSAPHYSDEQVAEAKANVCAAYHKVHQGVLVNTGRTIGDDPASIFAVAANARLALFDGGEYLSTKLSQEPAAPSDLSDAVRALVGAYQQLTIDYLAEVPEAEAQASLGSVDTASDTVFQMCQ